MCGTLAFSPLRRIFHPCSTENLEENLRARNFQKESLSEYGSGWEWEYNTYAHVFDNEPIVERLDNGSIIRDNVPIRYSDNGTIQGNCINDYELTNGEILFSKSIMYFQKSCTPNTGNAGNYYSFPGATAGSNISSGNAPNSVCPRGWQLTVDAPTVVKSWSYLITKTYNISDTNDSKLRPSPLSFIRSGNYNQGSLSYRASYGRYWSSSDYYSERASGLYFHSSNLNPDDCGNNYKYYGHSVRCVSK